MKRQRHRPLPPPPQPTSREVRRMIERKIAADREMWAYDNLPPPLRRALSRGALPPSAEVVRDQIPALQTRLQLPRNQIVEMMATAQPAVEDFEIDKFAQAFERRYGTPLPHAAARATVLRDRS